MRGGVTVAGVMLATVGLAEERSAVAVATTEAVSTAAEAGMLAGESWDGAGCAVPEDAAGVASASDCCGARRMSAGAEASFTGAGETGASDAEAAEAETADVASFPAELAVPADDGAHASGAHSDAGWEAADAVDGAGASGAEAAEAVPLKKGASKPGQKSKGANAGSTKV